MKRLALASVLLTTSCGLSLQNAPIGTGGSGYQVTAVFSDVGRLPMGGAVRLGQAVVGSVSDISTENFRALVELDIEPGVRLPAGTTARLELASPLGEEFVVLQPPPAPGGPELTDGSVIPLEQTSRGPDVENALAAASTLLNGAGLDQAKTVVTELNTALSGREQQVRDLLGDLERTLASLDERRGELTRLIDSVHATSQHLADDRATLEAALTRVRPAIDVLLAERERFTNLLDSTAALSAATASLVEQTDESLITQVEKFRPVLADLRSLDGGLATAADSLRRFFALIQQAAPGDYVLFNGTLDVPGTVVQLLAPGAPMPPPAAGGVDSILRGGTR
ncbi:phospholipid/cholesterol/gamma-HCH transport system substrate-binding protein [Saccharopolyspora kobensis]|uniref:Phospholipid/cholesterol/gamma-HCH transport system substrate-binding protein n=1 Tax=Saccharopolyspora kobensis TaxID=146035 RepID=A0A1H5W846_9PSEU|nr:MCE family protein [Saccharopolyspora kobensis]SEF95642.1 phospholipid/cholesterol/gamma-HCH transport system substrate-binding protein [Saccharopolyspora kobensis]SFD73232.1 phospholipid/cholesterol/gamma-HCH transport system substrate-binding protein [Saccharopolyspora kobensis]